MHVYDATGQCIDRVQTQDLLSMSTLCEHNDSLFAMPGIPDPQYANAQILSIDGTVLDEIQLPPLKWPRLSSSLLVRPGISMGCFDDGPWYVGITREDAMPLLANTTGITYKPKYYRGRRRDLPKNYNPYSNQGLRDGTSVQGLYRLNRSTRLVAHVVIKKSYDSSRSGLTIAGHDQHYAISTTTESFPLAAGYGHVYFRGDHETLSNGELGNPLLLRYRFIPPENYEE